MKPISIKRLSINSKGLQQPCSTGLTFQSDVLLPATGEWDNKIVGGDNALLLSNVILLNAASTTTFTEEVLKYVSKVDILHSVDNVTWSVKTDDTTLYTINTTAKTLSIIKTGEYYANIILYYNDGINDIPWILCNFSSNGTSNWNIIDESNWKGFLVPHFSLTIKDSLITDLLL